MEQRKKKREKAYISQPIDCWRQQPVSFLSYCLPARCISPVSVQSLRVSSSKVLGQSHHLHVQELCCLPASTRTQERQECSFLNHFWTATLQTTTSFIYISKKLHHRHKQCCVLSRFLVRHHSPMEVSLGVPRFTSTPAATWLWVSTASLTWRLPKEQILSRSCCWVTSVTRHWTPCPWHNAGNPNSWQKREPQYPSTELQHWCDAWWLCYKYQD